MLRYKIVWMAVVCLLLAGCGGGDLSKKVPGKWKMNVDTAGMAEKDKAGAEAVKGLLSAMSLELKADKTATMTAMGQNDTGTWSLEGNKITITTGKGKPMIGTVSGDGNTITPEMDADMSRTMGGAKITLTKEAQ